MKANEMIRELPLYERKNKLFIEVFNAEAKQFELMDEQIEDVRRQFFIDTATWGLKVYEKELKLIVPTGSTLENRRAAIKAKWRSDGKVDRVLLESVASAILQTVVKVEFDGRILFYFEASDDKIKNVGSFHKMIKEIKPAHLPMQLELRVSSHLLLKNNVYNFPVSYKITNTFQTDTVPGKLGRGSFALQQRSYLFDAFTPICGTFVTSTINSVQSNLNVELSNEYRDIDILYRRAGEQTITGEGEI